MPHDDPAAADRAAAPGAGHTGHPRSAVSARAVGLGIGCAALLCAVTPYNDYKVGATYLAGHQFPVGAIFVLFLLAALANPLLRALRQRWAFSRGELLTVWTLILVASGLPSSGMMRFLLPHIAAPQNFSNGVNNWEAKVWGGLPTWLRLSDRAAAEAYYSGYPRGAEHVPWGAWAAPLLGWGAFAALFLLANFCVANLLRRQWVENEKFSFPLVQLPLLLAEDPEGGCRFGPLLRSPALWVGVLLTTVLHTLNGLHLLYPTVPEVRTSVNLNDYLLDRPWSQIGATPMNFYPLVMGLAFLLPSEVAFSLWFFFLFYKAEALACAVYNWDAPGSIGSPSEKQFHALQAFGAAVGLVGWTLWTARRHLRDVWEKATGGPRAHLIDDSREMVSYRATVAGLAVSYAGMALWMYLATMPVSLILLSLLLLTVSLVTVAWFITQAGTLYMVAPCVSIDLVGGIAGTQPYSTGAWYSAQRLECMFYRDTRELLLPELLTGAKAADSVGFSPRPLFVAMAASVAVGFAVSLVASLWLPYHHGGANSLNNPWAFRTGPVRPLQLLGGVTTAPMAGAWSNGLHVAGGLGGVLAILALRARTGLALHPIGFIGASTVCGRTLWFSVLLGWACKALISRYGGMRGYRAALPLFLGLMLGDALNAVAWIVIGALTGTGYNILPS